MVRPSGRSARLHSAARRGFALVDAVIGGVILAVGLAAILSLTSRAVSMQRGAEIQVVAAWILDEQLAMVLVEGPEDFRDLHPTFGRCRAPFEEFEFEVRIADRGIGLPWRVTAVVRHIPTGAAYVAQTMIAERGGDEPNPERAPPEPIDREGRYDELRNPDRPSQPI
ncbi:MAG TPA: hypothetical protein PKC43_02940 [Phycisphaerales bacterium]|nr:hypothetical protein [Phycisphaerales bacterium]HMP36383.1 hypothetical protein [Phycisphaerales bacterium]